MRRTDLMYDANISSNVLARLGREEPVSMESLGKICAALHYTVDDIMKFISELTIGKRVRRRNQLEL